MTGSLDEIFHRKEASSSRYVVTDVSGSVIAPTDASGVLQTQYSFEPYGKTSTSGVANSNSQTYTAREDDKTGLLYYRARYYMPECARFISEDPLGLAAGPNTYAYVSGSPTNFTDPFGMTACDIQTAFNVARQNFSDLNSPLFDWSADLGPDDGDGKSSMFGGVNVKIHLQRRWMGQLTPGDAYGIWNCDPRTDAWFVAGLTHAQ